MIINSDACFNHLELKHKGDLYPLCPLCDTSFDVFSQMKSHVIQVHHCCVHCEEKFERLQKLITHDKSHVESEGKICEACGMYYDTCEELDKHVLEKHDDEDDIDTD